jgi:hypothetical protein
MYGLFKGVPYNTYEFVIILFTHTGNRFLKETRSSEHPKVADLEPLPDSEVSMNEICLLLPFLSDLLCTYVVMV